MKNILKSLFIVGWFIVMHNSQGLYAIYGPVDTITTCQQALTQVQAQNSNNPDIVNAVCENLTINGLQ